MEPLVKWKLLTHITAISSVPLINQEAVGKGEGMSFGLFVHVFLSYFHLLSKMKETPCICTRARHLDNVTGRSSLGIHVHYYISTLDLCELDIKHAT